MCKPAIAVLAALIAGLLATEANAQDCSSASAKGEHFSHPKFPAAPDGHHAAILITAPPGCPWAVASSAPYLRVLPPATGTGSAEVVIELLANPGDFRGATVSVSIGSSFPWSFTMTQRGCLSVLTDVTFGNALPGYALKHAVDAGGGVRYVKVNPRSWNCVWLAQSQVPWIQTAPGATGYSSGLVTYSVEPNESGVFREGTFTVGYLKFTVQQSPRFADDLNDDGHTDLIWQHQTTGDVAAWLMQGTRLIDGRLLTPGRVSDTAWRVVGSGDFTQDGHPDIVWQHEDGRAALWQMEGTRMARGSLFIHQMSPADADWRIRAVMDLNSDGHPDLIWQHRTNGRILAWIMYRDNYLFDASFTPTSVPDTGWRIAGAGDFNGDGQGDLVWHHDSIGQIGVWMLKWDSYLTWSVMDGTLTDPAAVADANWKIQGVADINRDGHADLLWHHQGSGLVATWLMRGIQLLDGTLLSPTQVSDTNWKLVGPR